MLVEELCSSSYNIKKKNLRSSDFSPQTPAGRLYGTTSTFAQFGFNLT